MNKSSYFFIILVFLIISYIHMGIIPAAANEDDWNNLTVTLGPENSVISVNSYTVEALKFDGYGMVWLQVSKNGSSLGDTVLENNSSGWCYMDNDNIRLKACNVIDRRSLPMFSNLCAPEAEVVFETKKPASDNVSLDLDLEADKDEYLLGDEVIVDSQIRNTGEVVADKIKFDLNPDGLIIQNEVPGNLALEKGSKNSFELHFRFPENIKEDYNITANVSWEDNSGKHFLSKIVEIKVSKPLEIYKNTVSDVFLESPAYVTISVKNVQDRPVNVTLIDLLPETFTLTNNSNLNSSFFNLGDITYLNQEFILSPEEMKTYSYSILSEQLGAHRVPQTHAYANLCGQMFNESSDSDNIITVYENMSYKEYKNDTSIETIPTEKIPPAEVKLHVNVATA